MAAKFQYVNNDNDVMSTDDQAQASQYEYMGYRKAGSTDISNDEIKQHYAGAWNTAAAAGTGVLNAIPGALPAGEWVGGQFMDGGFDQAKNAVQGLQMAHPVATGVGEVAGTAAAFATGEGALAELGMEGSALVSQMTRGAITNVALGRGKAAESAILAHATTPAGEEHTWADIGMDTMMEAALGAATAIPGKIVGKAAGYLGKAGDALASAGDKEAILESSKINDALARTRKDDVMKWFESKGYGSMSSADVQKDIGKRLPDIEAQFNMIKDDAKVPLPSSAFGVLSDRVGDCFPGELQAQGNGLMTDILAKDSMSVKDLHDLRQSIDKKIDYTSESPSDLDKAYHGAREEVSKALRITLSANDMVTNGARAQQWIQLDQEYSNLQVMQKVITDKPDLADALTGKAQTIAKNVQPFFKAAKYLGGFKGYFVGKELDKVLANTAKINSTDVASAAKGLGSIFNKQADVWTKAVQAGLYGAPEAALGLTNAKFSQKDYDVASQRSDWILQNPQQAASNMNNHMSAMGADGSTSVKMINRAVAISTYLSQQKPANPNMASIIPSHNFVPVEMKREWMEQYATAHDPTHALTNPTGKNMAVYKQFYPEHYQNTVNAVTQQLQKNPNMPLASRLWASRVLGAPVDALTQPKTWELIQMGRQAAAQQVAQAQAQGKNGQKSGNSGSSTVDSNSTSLQHLQGKQ